MTAKHKCSAKTPDMYGVPNIYPCRRSGTKERNGEWYCWQHDPEYIAKKAMERRAAWEAEMNREAAKYARIARNARLGALVTEETAALLERLAKFADSAWGPTLTKQANDARALAASIREALALEVNE